ncbi:MAG: MBL fold metallo-hydrolase [Bacteroidales bacterium]|nr:MBL fold metallo-hydrolase [Bacteroidales bacterium]
MVQICALASGSNGNCYYIGNEEEAILVDIGISNAQLIKRLNEADLSLSKIKALFVTHEHTDHIKGMRVVTNKHNIKAYATEKTWEQSRMDFRSTRVNTFTPGDTISVGSIKIHSFSKKHDAIDPVSFRVEIDGISVAVLTDLGVANEEITEHLKLCDAAFLESNYEPQILETGRYPVFLKRRVASDTGHLSNNQAFELVKSLNGSPLKTIFLSHISKDNNDLEIAMETFKSLQEKICIELTSRETISRVVEI